MASRRSRCLQSAVARTESAAESRWIHRHTRSPASRKGFDASSLTNSSALQAKTLPVEIPAIMNQPPGNLNDQIGQLTYRPERMAIHWLDELGAAHVPSASQGRVLGFIGDDGAVELANIVEGLAGKARMRLRPGLGSSSEPHALARSAAEAKPVAGNRPRRRPTGRLVPVVGDGVLRAGAPRRQRDHPHPAHRGIWATVGRSTGSVQTFAVVRRALSAC